MKVLSVPGMRCIKCVERIKNALDAEGIKAEVDLNTKTVKVDDEYAAAAAEALDDIGFDSAVK